MSAWVKHVLSCPGTVDEYVLGHIEDGIVSLADHGPSEPILVAYAPVVTNLSESWVQVNFPTKTIDPYNMVSNIGNINFGLAGYFSIRFRLLFNVPADTKVYVWFVNNSKGTLHIEMLENEGSLFRMLNKTFVLPVASGECFKVYLHVAGGSGTRQLLNMNENDSSVLIYLLKAGL